MSWAIPVASTPPTDLKSIMTQEAEKKQQSDRELVHLKEALTEEEQEMSRILEMSRMLEHQTETENVFIYDGDADLALAMQIQQQEEEEYEMQKQQYHAHNRSQNKSSKVVIQSKYFGDANEYTKGDTTTNINNVGGEDNNVDKKTKHDLQVDSERNKSKLDDDKSSLRAGNTKLVNNHSVRISGSAFNSLQHKIKKQSHITKGISNSTVEKDTFATSHKGLDQKTRLLLHGMINTKLLNAIHGKIKAGKEASVYYAVGPKHIPDEAIGSSPGVKRDVAAEKTEEPPTTTVEEVEYAIKVFTTTLTGFKNRTQYINSDHRFSSYGKLKHQNPRKIVSIWCEKELANLQRIFRANIPCPQPIRMQDNVLVMEFIGRDSWAAPQLREANISRKRLRDCYIQCVLILYGLFHECKLVHADFSEYNILYHKHVCYVIDVGQAVDLTSHAHALEFLLADCKNITNFFLSRGMATDVIADHRVLFDLVQTKFKFEKREHEAARDNQFNIKLPQSYYSWINYDMLNALVTLIGAAA